jgi:hypothetical protein
MELTLVRNFAGQGGKAWAKSPMLALKSDRQRLGGLFALEAMTQIPFQKLVTLAYNLHRGRAQTFAITGAGSISISLSRCHTRDIKIEILAPHPPNRTESPKMSPCALRALDYVSNRHQNNKPFNPEHLLPTQRKKTFALRLHRGRLVLAVGVVCRCTCPKIGWKVRYAVSGDGPGCFHTTRTRLRRRRHRPG